MNPFVFDEFERDIKNAQNGGVFKFAGNVSFETFPWPIEEERSDDNNMVRVTMQPGATYERSWHKPHEEGYSYNAKAVSDNGELWEIETSIGGRDCDGPIERSYTDYSDGMISSPSDESYNDLFPGRSRRIDGKSSVYDAYAQDAGY